MALCGRRGVSEVRTTKFIDEGSASVTIEAPELKGSWIELKVGTMF